MAETLIIIVKTQNVYFMLFILCIFLHSILFNQQNGLLKIQ